MQQLVKHTEIAEILLDDSIIKEYTNVGPYRWHDFRLKY